MNVASLSSSIFLPPSFDIEFPYSETLFLCNREEEWEYLFSSAPKPQTFKIAFHNLTSLSGPVLQIDSADRCRLFPHCISVDSMESCYHSALCRFRFSYRNSRRHSSTFYRTTPYHLRPSHNPDPDSHSRGHGPRGFIRPRTGCSRCPVPQSNCMC